MLPCHEPDAAIKHESMAGNAGLGGTHVAAALDPLETNTM
jgi:hypothetical protein